MSQPAHAALPDLIDAPLQLLLLGASAHSAVITVTNVKASSFTLSYTLCGPSGEWTTFPEIECSVR